MFTKKNSMGINLKHLFYSWVHLNLRKIITNTAIIVEHLLEFQKRLLCI